MKTGTLVKLKSDLYTSGDQPVTLNSVGVVVEVEKLPGPRLFDDAEYYVKVKWAGIECPIRQGNLYAYHDIDLDVLAEA